jgi:hypothetical protein
MRTSDRKTIRRTPGGGCDAQAIAAAEQQAHGGVILILIAKREGDARSSAPAPVLVLWLWNGINMRIARLERVRRNERGAAIGGRRVFLLIVM